MRYFIQRFYLYCLMLGSAVSCIDDYELPSSDTKPKVVIFGQIVGESDCLFSLRSTSRPTGEMEIYMYIPEAKIQVIGTDGQSFEGHIQDKNLGQYVVPVGKLDPKQKYYVRVSTMFGDFESEPMLPLDAPDLSDLYYEQPREDKKVDIVLSTQDPQKLVYFLWQVDEYWEITTPVTTKWEYRVNPGEDPYGSNPKGSFVELSADEYTNHGWRHSTSITDFASNQEYACAAITQRCICQRDKDDRRFQHRCLIRIRQMAVTREEYEYRKLMKVQSSEVGGLFSQMPSELPTNIKSLGKTQAIGYIGVRGHTSVMEMYVDGSDVDYRGVDNFSIIPESEILSPIWMINNGYAVYSHNPETNETDWTYDWCVDYRSSYWGGTEAMKRPDFWQDK